MKKLILFCLLLQIVCFVCRAQHFRPLKVNRDSIRGITKEDILKDLDEYADGIGSHHVSPFTITKRNVFYAQIEKIKREADNYDSDELLTQFMQLNATIHDEHTKIIYLGRDIFPFACYWFQEGIYITRTRTEDLHLLYSRVIAVNNIPINEVADRIATIEPNQNEPSRKTALQHFLFDPFIMHGLQIAPTPEDVTYTLVTFRNDTVTITPQAVDKRKEHLTKGFDAQSMLRTNRHNASNWFKYIDTANYLYFKYSTCHDEQQNMMADLMKKLIDTIEARSPKKIIVDMRDNGGGYPKLLDPFIQHLIANGLNKKGYLYVLTGRETFSSGIVNSSQMRKLGRATLVGEETRGNTEFFAGVHYFTLPTTNLKVSYSTRYWKTEEKYEGPLRPDVVIPETFADYSKGVDAAMVYVLSH